MKKIYLSLMAVAAMTFAACGGNKSNASAEAADAEGSEEATEKVEANENPTMEQCFAQFDIDAAKLQLGGGKVTGGGHIKEAAIHCNANIHESFADGIDKEKAEAWKNQVFDYCKSIAKDGKIYQIPEYASDKDNPKEVTSAEDAFKANGRMATGWCFDTKEFRVAVTVETDNNYVECQAYSLSFQRNSEKK